VTWTSRDALYCSRTIPTSLCSLYQSESRSLVSNHQKVTMKVILLLVEIVLIASARYSRATAANGEGGSFSLFVLYVPDHHGIRNNKLNTNTRKWRFVHGFGLQCRESGAKHLESIWISPSREISPRSAQQHCRSWPRVALFLT